LLVGFLIVGACAGTDRRDDRLETSRRHHEWTDIRSGGRDVRTFVVYPEVSSRVPAIVVIHENKGLTDWVRSVADRLGEAGYIAVAPDLLSGAGPEGGATESFATQDAATKAISGLPPDQVTADLHAVADYARSLPASDGKLAVGGFCWGGSQTFRFATNRPDLAAAYVFYGGSPEDPEAPSRIRCPVYGFYAENDMRINAGLPATEQRMRSAGKFFEPVVYLGAGHGFMRSGEQAAADSPDRRARDDAWDRWLTLLRRL
jgi:carboxymethylenebutenolidase